MDILYYLKGKPNPPYIVVQLVLGLILQFLLTGLVSIIGIILGLFGCLNAAVFVHKIVTKREFVWRDEGTLTIIVLLLLGFVFIYGYYTLGDIIKNQLLGTILR